MLKRIEKIGEYVVAGLYTMFASVFVGALILALLILGINEIGNVFGFYTVIGYTLNIVVGSILTMLFTAFVVFAFKESMKSFGTSE